MTIGVKSYASLSAKMSLVYRDLVGTPSGKIDFPPWLTILKLSSVYPFIFFKYNSYYIAFNPGNGAS